MIVSKVKSAAFVVLLAASLFGAGTAIASTQPASTAQPSWYASLYNWFFGEEETLPSEGRQEWGTGGDPWW
jgi:hypothetical protein